MVIELKHVGDNLMFFWPCIIL